MFCNQCRAKAEFQCCSNFFCTLHFNQHIKKVMKHDPSSLTFELDQTENYILNQKLDYLIKSLKTIKKKAIIDAERIITAIIDMHNLTLNKISDLIKHFNDLRTS